MLTKPKQKMISFSDNPRELKEIQEELDSGWSIVHLIPQNSGFLAIFEQTPEPEEDGTIRFVVPPRKKIQKYT